MSKSLTLADLRADFGTAKNLYVDALMRELNADFVAASTAERATRLLGSWFYRLLSASTVIEFSRTDKLPTGFRDDTIATKAAMLTSAKLYLIAREEGMAAAVLYKLANGGAR